MFAPTHIKVFLGSPSDVKDGRDAAVRVLKRIADTPAFRGRVTIQVFAYDDEAAPTAMPASATPQLGIVKYGGRPAEHDFTIIILWARMGTRMPPSVERPSGGVYESGTQWEYEDARRAGKDAFVYLRTDPPPPATAALPDAQEQLEKLRAFVDGFRNADGSLAGFVTQYRDPPGLDEILNGHMQGVVRHRVERAERRRTRTIFGALAGLAMVTAGVLAVVITKANRPQVAFTSATECQFAQHEGKSMGFLTVAYDVMNAHDTESVYLALYKEQVFSHAVVRRQLKSKSASGWPIDFEISGPIILPAWARIEVDQGSRTSAVSPSIPIACGVKR